MKIKNRALELLLPNFYLLLIQRILLVQAVALVYSFQAKENILSTPVPGDMKIGRKRSPTLMRYIRRATRLFTDAVMVRRHLVKRSSLGMLAPSELPILRIVSFTILVATNVSTMLANL